MKYIQFEIEIENKNISESKHFTEMTSKKMQTKHKRNQMIPQKWIGHPNNESHLTFIQSTLKTYPEITF